MAQSTVLNLTEIEFNLYFTKLGVMKVEEQISVSLAATQGSNPLGSTQSKVTIQ